MICNNCKAEIEADCEFCPECGIPVTAESTKPKPSKKRRLIIIGAAGVVLIVAVVMLILMLTGAFKKTYKLSDEAVATLNNLQLVLMIEDYLNDYQRLVDEAASKGTTTGTTTAIELFLDYYDQCGDYMDGETKRICASAYWIYCAGELEWYWGYEHREYIQGYRDRLKEFEERYCK